MNDKQRQEPKPTMNTPCAGEPDGMYPRRTTPKPEPSGELVKELRRVRLLFTNGVGEKPYYRCEDEQIRVFVADDQLFCTIQSPDFQGDYDLEMANAFCEIGEILEQAAEQLEKKVLAEKSWGRQYYEKCNELNRKIAELKAEYQELCAIAHTLKETIFKESAKNKQLTERIKELEKGKEADDTQQEVH